MAGLVLMCGLPGAGQTAAARALARTLPALRLAPAEWLHNLGHSRTDDDARARVQSLQWQLAQALLKLDTSVILQSGFWARRERDSFRDRARELGAAVHLIYLTVPVDELPGGQLAQRHRDGAVGAISTTTQPADWAGHFEPPDAAELAGYDPLPRGLTGSALPEGTGQPGSGPGLLLTGLLKPGPDRGH